MFPIIFPHICKSSDMEKSCERIRGEGKKREERSGRRMERGGRITGCKQGAQSYRTGSVLWIRKVARANRAEDNEKQDVQVIFSNFCFSPH